MMNHRERINAILKGEIPDIIPSFGECPMDVTCIKGILPEPTGDIIIDGIKDAEFYDNSCICVNVGPNVETISRSENHHTYRYETGAVWHESYNPTFCREPVKFPINDVEDIDGFVMPCAESNVDFEEMKRTVAAWKQAGYFVQGNTWGAWQGIYYLLTKFENILMWMAIETEAAHKLFKIMGDYSIDAAKIMLEAGVDAVFVPSDFGSGHRLLFSPEMFYQYVFPWLKELADLCHSYGAILHLHSHGHIQDLMDMIIESGVDMINPVGPSDHNDLAMYKSRWGHSITIMGGISTRIAEMDENEMERHIAEVMEIGCKGVRFIPRTESGIPNMPAEKVLKYLELLKKYRLKYGRR